MRTMIMALALSLLSGCYGAHGREQLPPDAGPSCQDLLALDRARASEAGLPDADVPPVNHCWSADLGDRDAGPR